MTVKLEAAIALILASSAAETWYKLMTHGFPALHVMFAVAHAPLPKELISQGKLSSEHAISLPAHSYAPQFIVFDVTVVVYV